jgi:hypothetical protein
MPRLLALNHVLLLLCCSIYLGTGVSLLLVEFPLEPKLTVTNYYLILVEPVAAATRFFTSMTIVMLACAVIMLATEWFSGLRWVPVVVLLAIILATLLTILVIVPLNKELAAGITDPARLNTVLHQWANVNRVRVSLWAIQWAAMAYWFYRMTLQARADTYIAAVRPEEIALTPGSTKMKVPGRGIAFRETMTGRLTFGVTDPRAGDDHPAAIPFVLKASIDIRDINAFVSDPTHTGDLTGHLYAPRAGFVLPCTEGVFRLFSPSPDPKMTYMVYELGYRHDGKPYYFKGRKHVRVGWPWRAWRETTTLHVTLHEGDGSGPTIAAGILRLNVFDLLALVGTLHTTGCQRPSQRCWALMRFGTFFMREVWRSYVMRRPSLVKPA